MGWSNGSSLAETLWKRIENTLMANDVPSTSKQQLARDIVDLFESYDADTVCNESYNLIEAANYGVCPKCEGQSEDGVCRSWYCRKSN